jgi:response regulator of citrate/malate metabolism
MRKNEAFGNAREQEIAHKFDGILLIDDDEITNFINKDVLSNLNLSNCIEATTNIDDALSHIRSCFKSDKTFQSLLIILDLIMPERDGFELLDELNSQTGISKDKIDIVVLTNSLDQINKEKAEGYNILDYVQKPLTHHKLQQALGKKIK